MEGGASRTVFSCGVTDCFLEEGIMPDYFVGVSAGIAYGVSYLSGQIGRNREIFEKYMPDKRYMGLKYLFDRHMKSYYNIPFVFGEVPNKLVPFDFDAFRAYREKQRQLLRISVPARQSIFRLTAMIRILRRSWQAVHFRFYFSRSRSEKDII